MKWTIARITLNLICASMCISIATLQQGCESSEPEVDEGLPTEVTSDQGQVPLTEEEPTAEVKPPEVDLTLLPEVNSIDIWNYLTKENPYTKWSLFPAERIPEFAKWEEDEDYVLPPPKFPALQGTVAKLYINDIALAAINDEPRDLPNGSIIIYEIHSIGTVGAPWGFSGRYKVEGASAKNNDWITFTYQTNGSVSDFGPNTRCHSCHVASDNDYVWIDSPLFDAKGTKVPALGW